MSDEANWDSLAEKFAKTETALRQQALAAEFRKREIERMKVRKKPELTKCIDRLIQRRLEEIEYDLRELCVAEHEISRVLALWRGTLMESEETTHKAKEWYEAELANYKAEQKFLAELEDKPT